MLVICINQSIEIIEKNRIKQKIDSFCLLVLYLILKVLIFSHNTLSSIENIKFINQTKDTFL